MKNYMLIIIAAFFVSAGEGLFGQYTGPGSTSKVYTIREILDNAARLDKSDELVKIKGFAVRQINNNTYEFRDNTGTILVDIDKKKLPAKPFDDKTELVIIGEVDHDLLEPTEIEAEEVYFANQ